MSAICVMFAQNEVKCVKLARKSARTVGNESVSTTFNSLSFVLPISSIVRPIKEESLWALYILSPLYLQKYLRIPRKMSAIADALSADAIANQSDTMASPPPRRIEADEYNGCYASKGCCLWGVFGCCDGNCLCGCCLLCGVIPYPGWFHRDIESTTQVEIPDQFVAGKKKK